MRSTLLLLIAGFCACGQTNVVQTNYVKGWHKLRVVNGQVYDSERSVKWEKLRGEFVGLSTNGAVFREIRRENRKGIRRASGQVETILETDLGPLLIVTNFPPQDIPRSGEAEFRGMQVGQVTKNGRAIPIYDYGTDHVVAIVSTNRPTPKKSGVDKSR